VLTLKSGTVACRACRSAVRPLGTGISSSSSSISFLTRSMFSGVVSRELGPLPSPVPSESVQVGGQKVELDR